MENIPLFIGFQHHPWWLARFQDHQTVCWTPKCQTSKSQSKSPFITFIKVPQISQREKMMEKSNGNFRKITLTYYPKTSRNLPPGQQLSRELCIFHFWSILSTSEYLRVPGKKKDLPRPHHSHQNPGRTHALPNESWNSFFYHARFEGWHYGSSTMIPLRPNAGYFLGGAMG